MPIKRAQVFIDAHFLNQVKKGAGSDFRWLDATFGWADNLECFMDFYARRGW